MKCVYCTRGDTRVLESRQSEDSLRRRRECDKCGKRFTTYERIEATNVLVIKRSGTRQAFSREKLREGIQHACEKRPVTAEQVERLIERVEEQVRKQRSGEVSSQRIGELVMKELKRLDKVAYIRFASVYLDFKDPEDFAKALEDVHRKK